ncbi:MAG: hypothetical protein H7835_20630, partial [Magnetococcus sp. XQGC-1]
LPWNLEHRSHRVVNGLNDAGNSTLTAIRRLHISNLLVFVREMQRVQGSDTSTEDVSPDE